ncbi:VOC family protein [Dinghuibacter silviterrae]|uniref:PhnB protein n=1 Tax=Dinghuibacter silviterrae TaxID=1539049 RepID=A0A4R8DQA6_9BACT|nr:VOC family protein [Dinghuibacter silviterrae]TDX00322.1 PhnB protein [Dinghuibacter silviterrae]
MPTTFTPQLIIPSGTMNLDFYIQGLGAVELRRFSDDDGSIHVSEMSIDGTLFHFHEEAANGKTFPPGTHQGVTTIIGLMVDDVDAVMARALAAGAREVHAAKDYEYGYRQGEFEDPLGHRWLIEKVI